MPCPTAKPGPGSAGAVQRAGLILFLCTALGQAVGLACSPAESASAPWIEREGMTALLGDWSLLLGNGGSADFALVRTGGPRPLGWPGTGILRVDLQGDILAQGGQRARLLVDPVMPFRPLAPRGPAVRWRWQTGFQVQPAPGLTLFELVDVESGREADPLARTPDYRQIEASVEVPVALARYRHHRLDIWAGRNWETWGPGWTGSLILDAHAPAPDGFGMAWSAESWSARFRWGRLDDRQVQDRWFSRYLAAHRLDLALTSRWRLGLSESALVATAGATPWWSLNPLLPFALAQQEDRNPTDTADILWALDSVWNPAGHWALYGQFLLDDFMLDGRDREIYPDQLGWAAGAIWASSGPRKPDWIIAGEYTRLDSWTYVHRDLQARYTAWQGALGHPGGPDSETVTLAITKLLPDRGLTALVWGRWHRRGRITLDTEETPVGSTGLPYPVPPVSRWRQGGFQVQWLAPARCQLEAAAGWTEISRDETEATAPDQPAPAQGLWTSLLVRIPLGRFVAGL